MHSNHFGRSFLALSALAVVAIGALVSTGYADEPKDLPRAFIDGTGPGWTALGEADFTKVNSADDTWSFKDGLICCTGKPISVMRTKKQFTNFEINCQWRHLRPGGNSGIFVWTTPESIEKLTKEGKPGLPSGIEVQVLDPAFLTNYEKKTGKKGTWFSCHGDVFPVRVKMTPFEPTSPSGSRSFPSEDRCRESGQWNHYYARCINGEVRLWVNGKEVSGGTNCQPRTGYLCLESEGSPIEFKNLVIRELP